LSTTSPHEVTQLLADFRRGEKSALDRLLPLVHSELKLIAQRQMRQERAGHTLQATALVNEVYLKLAGHDAIDLQNRSHFFAVCSQVMRHILIDHARGHSRDKRGGGAIHVSLDEALVLPEAKSQEVLALDEALNQLELLDSQKSRIVELRYFGGLSLEETAEVLNISPSTVQREWRRARTWLYRMISEGTADEAESMAKG
jgi:RNA polymerase sigma-70 factor, ECF subfamily